VHSFGKWYKV